MAAADALEWRQARQWLITSGVIPPTHRVTKPDVDLVDFARSLRDGVFLCSLLNALKQDCVEEWNPKPVMQHSYLRNINAFLQACKVHFNITDGDLFAENDLYDVGNFKKVMHLLSKLSHTPAALSLGLVPFPREETHNYYNQVEEEDIYATLQDISMQNTRIYANMNDLYAEVTQEEEDPYGYGDESVYSSICYYQAPPIRSTDADEKKSYVLSELFGTEKSFVTALEIIAKDFYTSLKDLLCEEELEILFSVAQSLLPVHHSLLEGFERCADGKMDVTKSFMSEKDGLLQYGLYAARLPMAVVKAKQLQNRGETAKLMQGCVERSNQRFPLSDLLNVPIQRVLKYPLLLMELKKCVSKGPMASSSEVSSLEAVLGILEDIAKYINSTKGDYENMRGVEEAETSLVDYRGPPLLQCGRYNLDGELRVKQVDGGGAMRSKWVFLFDKILLMCKKVNFKFGFEVRYQAKQFFYLQDIQVEPVPNTTRGRFSYAFKLIINGQPECIAYAKTEELKSQWIDAINHCREMVLPRDGKKHHHQLEYITFDDPSYCSACNKLLWGCYFQGYQCSVCKKKAHRECLKLMERCPAMQGRHHMNSDDTGGKVKRKSQTNINSVVGSVYIAKQRYEAFGPRSTRVLSFEKGEELEVVNALNAEWWEAMSLRTGNRGEVPATYLVKKQDDDNGGVFHSGRPNSRPVGDGWNREEVAAVSPGRRRDSRDPVEEKLKVYPWYLGKKSRIEAEQALQRMRDSVFLIRESDVRSGEYAIALKWNRMPKHIKIIKHPATRRFYVSDICDFPSVEDLVGYYQHNSLGASFPGVDTTLRYPYKEMIHPENSVRQRSISGPPPPSHPPPPPQPNVSQFNFPASSWAEVLFHFQAEYPGELTIEKHTRVRVLEKITDRTGWWFGEYSGRSGLFPANYVREIN